MTEKIKKLVAYRCLGQLTRLMSVLTIVKEGRRRGLPFSRIKKELAVNSNTLDYHLNKLVSANLLENYSRAPLLRREAELIGLVGTRIAPKVIDRVKQTRAYSYYRVTPLCREILGELDLVTPEKIRETLSEIERSKEFLKDHPIL